MGDTGPPPEWYLKQDKGPTIIATISSITALATAFVAARVFVKTLTLRALTVDDYVIVVSLVFGWLAVGFSIAAVLSGDGRHITALTPDHISGAIMWTMIGFIPSILSISVPKFAVVTLLVKLLNPTRAHQIFLWAIVTLSGLGLCGCMVILYAQCRPARSMWDFSVTDKSCWNIWILINYSRCMAVFAGLVDLYLAVYPATVLYTLQLNWKKKAALSGALGIGVISAVTAFYKGTTLSGLASPDFTWDTCDLTMWTCIEGGTIIIAACIPLLQPLLDLILGRRTLTSRNKSSDPSSNYKNNYYHEHLSSRDHHPGRSGTRGTELSSLGGSSSGRPGGRRMGKSDVETSILVTKNDDGGSQESILLRAEREPGRPTSRGGAPSDKNNNNNNDNSSTSPAAAGNAASPAAGVAKTATSDQAPRGARRVMLSLVPDQARRHGSGNGAALRGNHQAGIMMTHEVTVEYGPGDLSQSGTTVTSPARWKPM
ncbi:hypothetical protein Micbo1qcDRAFT_201487 [Microdochium bolleyi]|uniref:Rhodopsin domain-containing protein n=1 Tax=Microdochium bolleyi TaxID=196109 RepID=A0A136JG82_9PEZI|nr:hypothetical protein Micbo1qcDRAFT_201487 [Microdochium bolleyi]